MSEFDINKDCLNKCSSEVYILVTISNAQFCSAVPVYYQSRSMLQCGQFYWSRCEVVGDHVEATSQCEFVCHCINTHTQNCKFGLWNKPTETYPASYSVCEITLL